MDKPGLRDALPQPKLSDTRTDPFWSNLDSSLSAAAAPSAAQTPQRDLNVGLGDVARGVGAGALELVGGIGELARQASQFGKENAGKQGGDYLEQARANMASKLSPVLDVVAGAGDLAKSGAESLTDGMSGDAKEAIGRSLIDETPEGRLTMGDGAGDLDVWAMKMAQGVGSMVPTLLAGGVTGAAAKASIGRAVTTSMLKRGATQEVAEAVAAKTVAKLATGAAVTTGATGSVGSAGVNTRESVLGMSFDELSRSDTFRQAFTRIDQDQQTQHLSDEEKLSLARKETANVASRATMSDAKVWGAAAMGSVMGDAMLFKMLAGKAATGGVLKGAAKGAVGEGIGETLEEGVQQYTINESLNEVAAADIDPMKGVVSSALEGGLIGMGTGGALGGAGGLRGSKSQPESEGGAQVDPATVEDVAPVEHGDPMQANPAAAPADPDLVPAADTMADPVVAPSGEQSPLGPSASQFDELRDVPTYLRRDDTAERFKGMAADSEVQRALAGEFGQSVQELVASQMQAGDQGKSLYERAQAGELGLDPFAGNKSAQQVAMENQRPALPLKDVIFAGDANAARGMTKEGHFDDKQAGTGPQFRGAERTRWQSGQEGDVLPPESSSTKPAGELPGAVIEGEASEVGTELPHRDVVYGADQRQPDAKPMRGSATESAVGPLQTLRITRKGKPFATEKEAAMASRKGKEMPVPLNGGGFGVAEIAEVEQVQAANNPNAINGPQGNNQPQAEVSNEPVTPVPAISSEGQGDHPGAGDQAAAGAGPAIAGLTNRAGPGNPADNTPASPVPDGQQQDDQTLTAPATDAGVAVSGGAPEPANDWSGAKSAADYHAAKRRLFSGEMEFSEFQAMSRSALDNAPSLRAELEKKTKQDLLDQMSRFNVARYKNDKKAVVVEAAYNQLIGDLRWAANGDGNTISETYAIGGARQSIEERVAKALDGLTPERYQLFRDKQLSDVAEMQRRREELKQSLTDPQTLDDFKAFIERRGIDKLTQEQRARYEDMVAARNLDRREQERNAKGNETAPSATSSDIIKTKHTKTGDDLFVVQMGDRVERDAYNRINAHAKTLGGWYSSFRGKGAVPGFQFKSEEKATEFRAWLGGEVGGANPDVAPDQSTDSEAQPAGKSKQVEALRNRAASARAKAEAVFNADRKENTARRASMAANARANAERDLRFAGLLEAIATGIESGEITYLRNLANGAQLEELQSALNRGLWSLPATKIDALVSDGVINRDDSSRYSWSDKATPEQMVEGVSMPGMDYHTDRLREVALKMQGTSGFKQAGAKVMSLVKAAANRDNKTTTLSDPELIAKLKAYVTGSDDYSTSTIKDQIAGYGRLERMGITNHTELRAALRELVRLQRGLNETAPQRDPVTEKTNALKRRLLNNRNAFIDFFPTPEEYAADLVDRLGIEPGMVVLEPSAGHGMLAEAARDAGATVEAVELASDLRDILQEKGFYLVGNDFMETTPSQRYDAVIMNPPFSNDMDIDHVRHAFAHLKPGGRLAAIVSSMAGQRSNKKNKAFREWLDDLGASEEMMPEGAFKDSLNPTSVRTKIITIEKPVDAVNGPELKAGARATLHTPKGKPVEVQYRLMESGDLVASHEFDGTINRSYPQELQPRDRSKSTYQVQVRQIANNPEGRRLGASPETDRGAPIVRDGIVESGNGRTIGLQQAYRQGSADAYREWLMEHAEDFGISPDEVAAMSQPVLVRERLTEMSEAERRDFVVDSNTDAKMANSASEDANADAGKLDDKLMGMLNIPEGGDLLAMSNEPFLNAFARAIGENTLNQYKDDRGRWNDAYRRRVSAAIFAYGYDNASLLKAATGDSDQVGKNLIGALMNNAGKMAELRSAMPEHAADLSNIMAEGVTVMSDARRNHQAISEIVNQGDMVSGGVSRAGGAMAEMLADASRSAKRMTETIGAILDMLNHAAKHAGQPDLLTGKPSDPISTEEAINAQEREFRTRKEREQSALRPSQDFFGVSGPRNDHGKNTGVSGSAGEGQAKDAGKLTSAVVEVGGVRIRIPAIDEEQQRLYNQATHRGHGVNFASGISAGVGRILNDLKDSSLLDAAEQRAAAEGEVQAWANNEAVNARSMMQYGIKNPSWVITGRSGRKAQSSSTTERENNRQTQHHKDQDARIKALRDELKKLRPKEVIGRESFSYAWGKAKGMIAEYASALSGGQPNLLASLRKSMNSELARYLQAMGKIDAQGFIKTLSEQDNRLKAAGYDGLVAIVGARSNPGKIISDAINGRIRFSKQAMAQGEKPAKHLTRKEAELVTKEWFKQYRGASGIDVQIHATQAELEKALGLAAQDGLIRRAAFDDDSGTLHVAADTIANPKRMREILRHEVLAHYGLANVLGDGEYTKLISRIIKSKSAPSMKAVWEWVDTHYAGEDVGVQAEEVIAHLAELEQSAWRRGWDQVVAWVTKALRTVGFVPGGITAAETRVLIEGLGKKMKRGGPDDGGPDGGQRFSQESEQPAKKGGLKMSQANTAADKAMEKLNLGPKPDIIDKTKANLDKLRKVDRGVVESWVDRFIKKANTEVLDALAPIKYAEDAAGITDAADSGYVAARMATGAASTMQATMLYGLPEWKDGVIQRKAGTGEKDALLGIFSDLGSDLHNWLGWMAGHRAELLMAQGRENLLDANDIAALKGQGKGKEAKFLDAKARWNRLNAATLDLAQEAGLFTKEARAEFENEWYIPFFRESDDGDVIAPFKPKGIANQNAGIKKLKGGEANTNDLLENIFTSTSKLIDASMKNMAAQKTVWNLADTGLIEVIPKPNKMDYQALANGKDRIMLKLEGEEYMLRVEDPDLYRAMTFFDRKPFGKMTMMASSAKRILTAGVTASPEFMLRNFLRDSLSSWAISKDGFKPVIDSIKGVKKTLAMDGSTIDVMFSGASFLGGYVNGNDPGAMADTVRKSLRRKGMTPEQIARYEKSIIRNAAHAKGVVADAWEKYSRYGEALENANREAVYAAAIKAGKSHAQAAFESKDLMDFSMLGAARAIQGASLVLPFFNARLQGLGKLSRELRDNPREIAKRAGMITAMSLGLLAANWDDERYEELPDWDKDANWHFFVGDQHFRIPKPFEIGVMFGTIPERMVRAMGDKDTGAQFGKAVARAIGDTFALNPTPQIIKPLVEAAFNYDTFRGGPIDSPQDLAVKAEARYNEQTSLLMRELGELSGFSPKQLEHLVIGYTGTIGGYVMATADGLIRASRPGESASWRADEIPLVKAVYRGTGPAKSTQHMEEFYRMLNEVNQLKRTVDQYRSEGLDDKANELLEEQGGILKARRSLSRTQQQVRVVRNKIELIQRDRTMNAEEKRKRIDELLARRNDLVYQAVNKNRENWE
ncbi:LPD38 domain-containing protein [Aeromonas veronii]